MTNRAAPSVATGDRDATRSRPLAQAIWNLRLLGLFLVGPGFGVGLVAAIFALPPELYWIAAMIFLLTLFLFALLVRGEWSRLAVEADR